MITFACFFGRHTPASGEIRNQGFAFTRCRRCRRDLVRAGSAWRSVPKGFRIVWRPGKRVESRQRAGHMLLGAPPAPNQALAVIEPSGGWRALPALTGAGLQMLLWHLADRRQDRRKQNRLRTIATARVLRLPAG